MQYSYILCAVIICHCVGEIVIVVVAIDVDVTGVGKIVIVVASMYGCSYSVDNSTQFFLYKYQSVVILQLLVQLFFIFLTNVISCS